MNFYDNSRQLFLQGCDDYINPWSDLVVYANGQFTKHSLSSYTTFSGNGTLQSESRIFESDNCYALTVYQKLEGDKLITTKSKRKKIDPALCAGM